MNELLITIFIYFKSKYIEIFHIFMPKTYFENNILNLSKVDFYLKYSSLSFENIWYNNIHICMYIFKIFVYVTYK